MEIASRKAPLATTSCLDLLSDLTGCVTHLTMESQPVPTHSWLRCHWAAFPGVASTGRQQGEHLPSAQGTCLLELKTTFNDA